MSWYAKGWCLVALCLGWLALIERCGSPWWAEVVPVGCMLVVIVEMARERFRP